MLVLNSAVVPTIADLKSHGKNLLKTLEIAHYAFLISEIEFAQVVPHFAIKSSHVQEFISATLGFKTYAALQAKIKEVGIKKIEFEAYDTEGLGDRIKKITGYAGTRYSHFLADYFNEYLTESGVVIAGPKSAVVVNELHPLFDYLPMMQYLHVAPFSIAMRGVVENSYTFGINTNFNDEELDGTHRFPLKGWIQVAILNNLLDECAEPYQAGKQKVKLPTSTFLYGTPRVSQRKDIFNLLSSTSVLGTEYYKLSENVLKWHKKQVEGLEADFKVSDFQLTFDMLPRIKLLLQNHVPSIVTDYKFNGSYPFAYDPYNISLLMDNFTPKVINAKIYEATEYFLDVCRNHLKDLNPVIYLEEDEANLSVRDKSVHELVWRRQVCDYSDNLINAAKYFFKTCCATSEQLDLKKVFFNHQGFLMFDCDHDIEFYLYYLGRKLTMHPYDFSIFFNLFSACLYLKYESMGKGNKDHIFSVVYLNFLLMKELMSIPVFSVLEEIFDMEMLEEICNLALRRYDQIACRFDHNHSVISLVKDGKPEQLNVFSVCPKGSLEDALLLYGYKMFYPETDALSLIEVLKDRHSSAEMIMVRQGSKNTFVLMKNNRIVLDAHPEYSEIKTNSRESHINAISKLAAQHKNSMVLDFTEVMAWVKDRFDRYDFAKLDTALKDLNDTNPSLYAILSHINRNYGYQHQPESPVLDDAECKRISIAIEKQF